VVTQPSENTSLPFTNRSRSQSDDRVADSAMMSGSESDLSDVPDRQTSTVIKYHVSANPILKQNGISHGDTDESDGEEDAVGSDDGDFEMESQPLENSASRDNRSSSEESRRPAKRKAVGIEDDEDIMNNPELYGIRRSVRRVISIDSGLAR
jgi:chromodomain-helicase-DNA-binding protein 1